MRKLVMFSLVGCLVAFKAMSEPLDANTLEFLRTIPENNLPLPPMSSKEAKPTPTVPVKKIVAKKIEPVETKPEPLKAEIVVVEPILVISTSKEETRVIEPKVAVKEKMVEPLIPSEPTIDTKSAVEVVFADDSYELGEDYHQMILGLARTFKNERNNKILIVTYNFDNGENIFSRKRLALNRATEIRSKLIVEGYKNFSIKLINTDDDMMKNIAEVSEIEL